VYDFRDESDDDSLMIDELPKKRRHTLESFSSLKLPSKLCLCFVQIISAVFLCPFLPLEQLPFIQEIFFMYFTALASYPAVVYSVLPVVALFISCCGVFCSGCCSVIYIM